MEGKETKKRAPNFSVQDCLFLAQLMGTVHPDFGDINLNFHGVDKHRFNSRINSTTKRDLWKIIEKKFNASATMPRDSGVLQKKWDNLVAKHRNIYSDYMRARSLTGRGPPGMPMPSILTEAVMTAIGKENVSVVGATGASFDTTMIMNQQLEQTSGNVDACFGIDTLPLFDQQHTGSDPVLTSTVPVLPVSSKMDSKCSCCCQCDDVQLRQLKKRKLELQIKILEKKLEE